MRCANEQAPTRIGRYGTVLAAISLALVIINGPANGQLRRDDSSRVALVELCDRSLPAGGARCPRERVVALDVRFVDPDSAQALAIVELAALKNGLFTIRMPLASSRDSARSALITIQRTPSGGLEVATLLRDTTSSPRCASVRAAIVSGDWRMLFGGLLMNATEGFFRCVKEGRGIH